MAAQTPSQPTPSGPEQPVPFEAVQPGPRSPVSKAAVPLPDELPDLTAIGWTIPPIRWGGNTMSNYNWNQSSGGGQTFSETQSVNLRASSYIYQPWYAQVSGDMGLLMGNSRYTPEKDGQATVARSTSMNYGGNLNLFPQSRFPFQGYFQTADSRASASAVSSHYTSMRMGARQSYRPETGPENYTASADRSIVTSGVARSIVDALQGTFSTTVDNHGFGANARYSRNTGDVGGQGSNLFSVAGNHSWRMDEEFNIASSANYTSNQVRVLNGTGLSINDSRLMQAGTSLSWIPDEELPLTIIGGGNLLNLATTTDVAQNNLTNLNGFANANYRFSNNLNATAGASLSQISSNGSSQLASGQNASVSYSGNPLVFGDYSYNWGTGAGISNQFISGGASNRSASSQVQHSILRNLSLSEASAITLNASQSYSLANNTASGTNGILTHSGGASWRHGLGQRSTGMLSITASDTLSSGKFSSHFRSLSTQGNLQSQLTSRSAFGANLNFVVSQQLAVPTTVQTTTTGGVLDTASTNTGSTTKNGSGQVTYSHRSPFDISNLVYTAIYQMNASQTNLRIISGDPNAMTWQTGSVFQQNADYRLGRLNFRATSSFAELNGKKNASLFFMISRDIGDF